VHNSNQSIDKHALSELTLDALIEIDRAKHGMDFDGAPVQKLGNRLAATATANGASSSFALVNAEFFHPLERLYRERRLGSARSIDDIQNFVRESASSLTSFPDNVDGAVVEQLQAFCLALHQQLLDDLKGENEIVVQEGGIDDRGTEIGLRAA
jgi:hypothetical protein